MTLDAGYLIWIDGTRRDLVRRSDGTFQLLLFDKDAPDDTPMVEDITLKEAEFAWDLLTEPSEQMTKEWFFSGKR